MSENSAKSENKCPICAAVDQQKNKQNAADELMVFGIILRDVVPMEILVQKMCDEHQDLSAFYFDSLVELGKEMYYEMKKDGKMDSYDHSLDDTMDDDEVEPVPLTTVYKKIKDLN